MCDNPIPNIFDEFTRIHDEMVRSFLNPIRISFENTGLDTPMNPLELSTNSGPPSLRDQCFADSQERMNSLDKSSSFFKYVQISKHQLPDGSFEERRIYRDSSGVDEDTLECIPCRQGKPQDGWMSWINPFMTGQFLSFLSLTKNCLFRFFKN
ncbi:hypothetical protein ACOME3_003165 [Neoechinorhynchus agilis]